ncbi:MAG: hypothetical protein Kilf2KO_18160 [Rhodospirillales bacterium]
MLVITGTIRIRPDALEAARPIMRAVLEASRAEKGCLLYAYALDVLDPGLIRISEQWESMEDLKAHAASAHIATWRSHAEELGVHDRKLQIHEVSATRDL